MTRQNRNKLTLAGILLFFAILIGLIIYRLFFYSLVNSEGLAKQFCECTQNTDVQKSSAVLSNDEFKYRIGLESCVGQDFKAASYGLNDDERYYFVEEIQKAVFKKCPLELSKVFLPLPHAPRIPKDTIAALPTTPMHN